MKGLNFSSSWSAYNLSTLKCSWLVQQPMKIHTYTRKVGRVIVDTAGVLAILLPHLWLCLSRASKVCLAMVVSHARQGFLCPSQEIWAGSFCLMFSGSSHSSLPFWQVALKYMRSINAGVQRQIQQEEHYMFEKSFSDFQMYLCLDKKRGLILWQRTHSPFWNILKLMCVRGGISQCFVIHVFLPTEPVIIFMFQTRICKDRRKSLICDVRYPQSSAAAPSMPKRQVANRAQLELADWIDETFLHEHRWKIQPRKGQRLRLEKELHGFLWPFWWDHLCSLGTRTSWPTWIGLLVQMAWTVRFTWFLPQRSKMFEDIAAITAVLNAEVMEFCPFSLADMIFVAGAFQSHTLWTMTAQPKWLDWCHGFIRISLQEKAISVANMKSLSHWSVQRASEAGGDSEISKLCWLPTYAVHAVVPASTVAWCAGDSAGVLPRVWLLKHFVRKLV